MATLNIKEFQAVMSRNRGVMRANRFFVSFTPPLGIRNGRALGDTMEFYCMATNLPGSQMHVGQVRRYGYGPVEQRPYCHQFGPVQLVFMSDGLSKLWNFWTDWQQYISPHDTRNGFNGTNGSVALGRGVPYEIEYKINYATDIAIYVLDEAEQLVLSHVIREAFPSQVSDLQFDWADNNSFARFAVQIEYLDWYRTTASNILAPVP